MSLHWMKQLVAWPMFWLTYYSGHLAFLVCDCRVWPDDIQDGTWHDRVFTVFYELYQGGMRQSMFWSDWGDLKQWSKP